MIENCEVTVFEEEKIENVQNAIKSLDINFTSSVLKSISDKTRLTIMYALLVENELCVCDLSAITKSTIANTSHHLKKLSSSKIVKNEKVGKMVYCSFYDENIKQLVSSLITP